MYDSPVNLSSEFRNGVEKLSKELLELMFVPVSAATDRYQVKDTHLHQSLKDYTRTLASLWYTTRMKVLKQMLNKETSSISSEDYHSRVSKRGPELDQEGMGSTLQGPYPCSGLHRHT